MRRSARLSSAITKMGAPSRRTARAVRASMVVNSANMFNLLPHKRDKPEFYVQSITQDWPFPYGVVPIFREQVSINEAKSGDNRRWNVGCFPYAGLWGCLSYGWHCLGEGHKNNRGAICFLIAPLVVERSQLFRPRGRLQRVKRIKQRSRRVLCRVQSAPQPGDLTRPTIWRLRPATARPCPAAWNPATRRCIR